MRVDGKPGAPWVLLVEDDPLLRETLSGALAESGFRIRAAADAKETFGELARQSFDAILLDVELPDLTGFDIHRLLADRDELRDMAVLYMSGTHLDEADAVRALDAGASDYLRRPFGLGELRSRLAAAIASRRTISELRRIGSMDALTGLLNRRAFLEALERERRRATRDSTTMALVVLDVDRFKQVNDQFGHAAGDAALQAVGAILRESCRVTDVAARIGGEEFALALPSTDLVGARGLAEKLRSAMGRIAIPLAGGFTLSFTASFGAAAAHGDHLAARDSALALLAFADAALYRAKRGGRDRVEAA